MKKAISLLLALLILAIPVSALADEGDEEAPIIWMQNLEILITDDRAYAEAGDVVTVAVPVTDNIEVASVTIVIESPSGKNNIKKNLTRYKSGDWFYIDIPIFKDTEIGHWNIAKLKATDTNGKYMYITNLTEYKFGVLGKLADCDVTLPNGNSYVYTPGGVKPKVKVTYRGAELKQNTDYTVSYQNNANVGTGTVTVTGLGCVSGTVKKTFKITPKNSFKVTLSANTFYYNGKVKTPTVKVTDGKYTVPKSNYTVTYSKGRKNVGKYSVKVVMKNNYAGAKTMSFVIKPQTSAITKLEPGKKTFKVTWKKQSTQTTGYQIQYSTSNNFTAGTTKHFISANHKKFVRTVTKLKPGKRYYVRVRTYKKIGNSTYYSKWSATKNVLVK